MLFRSGYVRPPTAATSYPNVTLDDILGNMQALKLEKAHTCAAPRCKTLCCKRGTCGGQSNKYCCLHCSCQSLPCSQHKLAWLQNGSLGTTS